MSDHDFSSLTTEELIEQWGAYMNGKIRLRDSQVQALCDELERRGLKDIPAEGILQILCRKDWRKNSL